MTLPNFLTNENRPESMRYTGSSMFNLIVGNPANLAKIPPTGRTMEWDEKEKTWSPAYEITPHSLEKKQPSSK